MNTFTQKQDRLLKLITKPCCEESDFSEIVNGLNIDTAKMGYLSGLSYIGHRYGWDKLPQNIEPRISGLRRQRTVTFMYVSKGVEKLIDRWNKEGILYFVFGDFALKLHGILDDSFRIPEMKVFIHDNNLAMAVKYAAAEGFVARNDGSSFIFKNGFCTVRIYTAQTMNVPQISNISTRAINKKINGIDYCIASCADLLMLSLYDAWKLFLSDFNNDTFFMAVWKACNILNFESYSNMKTTICNYTVTAPLLFLLKLISQYTSDQNFSEDFSQKHTLHDRYITFLIYCSEHASKKTGICYRGFRFIQRRLLTKKLKKDHIM